MSDDPVIEADALAAATSAITLDARDVAAFQAGRLAGAVRVPIEMWVAAASAPATTFANVAHWQGAIGALGIDGARPVLVYDDGRMIESARVWFILQHFGAPARVINGGWPAIASHGASRVETGEAQAVAAASFAARPGSGPVGLVDRDGMKAQIDSATQIFDTRTAGEFAGTDPRPSPRKGHLPGAINLTHTDLLDTAGRLRAPSELAAILGAAGFRTGGRMVTHCAGGGRAALAAIAALRAGYSGVDTYYLSFSDWVKDDSCPVVQS